MGDRSADGQVDYYYGYDDEKETYQGKTYYIVQMRSAFAAGNGRTTYCCHLGVAEDGSKIYQTYWPALGKKYSDTFRELSGNGTF